MQGFCAPDFHNFGGYTYAQITHMAGNAMTVSVLAGLMLTLILHTSGVVALPSPRCLASSSASSSSSSDSSDTDGD